MTAEARSPNSWGSSTWVSSAYCIFHFYKVCRGEITQLGGISEPVFPVPKSYWWSLRGCTAEKSLLWHSSWGQFRPSFLKSKDLFVHMPHKTPSRKDKQYFTTVTYLMSGLWWSRFFKFLTGSCCPCFALVAAGGRQWGGRCEGSGLNHNKALFSSVSSIRLFCT